MLPIRARSGGQPPASAQRMPRTFRLGDASRGQGDLPGSVENVIDVAVDEGPHHGHRMDRGQMREEWIGSSWGAVSPLDREQGPGGVGIRAMHVGAAQA